jgi:type IV pilus assembly protein PilW
MRTFLSAPFLRQNGFSLVELMISLVLGGLVIAAVGTVYLGSRQSFRTQDAMGRMQEGARYAFETLSVDLRQVGFGCASVNTDAVDATWYNNLFKRPLLGYESGAGLPADGIDDAVDIPAPDEVPDALMVLRADKSRESQLATANTTTAAHGVSPSGLVVITEVYKDATVYTASAASGSSFTLNQASALPCKPGAPIWPPVANYMMLPLSGHIYYLKNNAAGEPSLYRETLLANGTTEAQELVEGVENMQIMYGEDTSQVSVAECPDDGCSADVYVAANAVTNWNRVVSVRLTLTMRSAEANVGTGGDGRIRKTFNTTIAVRNRL